MSSSRYFIETDLEAYLIYIASVRNLSSNTVGSYKRDLLKLVKYLQELGITSYSEATESVCSSWVGNLLQQIIIQRVFRGIYLQLKDFSSFY